MALLKSFKLIVQPWLQLVKFRLSLSVALSALAGYFLYKHTFDFTAFYLLLGVMLLASGVAVLNQCQEWKTDSLMPRTKKRPIPCGSINMAYSLIFAFFMGIAGICILFFTTNIQTVYLGVFNIFWYNIVYTLFKRKTAFAFIIGALCGAIPPLMGWVAAGGYLWHPKILLLSFFIFLWQIPHFWLILLKYGKEYAKAGLPSVTKLFHPEQLRGITFIWLIASGVSALLLPTFSMVILQASKSIILFLVIVLFIVGFWAMYRARGFINYRLAFVSVNLFLVLLMFVIIFDKVFI